MTRKILHAADIHLDSPLQRLGTYEQAPVERIREASRRALENLVDVAIDQTVDLVVIAGDLYDGDWPDQNTGLFFVAQAAKLTGAGIPVVVIRGNHDAANRMTSTLPLPKNPDGSEIMLSSDRVDLRSFEATGIAVHGRSFRNRAEPDNMAAEYPAPIPGMFNVGLLHTSLTGADGHDPYAPCTPAQLTDKDYDYWALGHVHLRRDHGLSGAAPIVFSGNVQGRHIRETGPKGCIVIEIDSGNRPVTRFEPLDVLRWSRCELDMRSCRHLDDVADAFQRWLETALAESAGRLLVVRVELVGPTPLHQELHRRHLQVLSSLRATSVTYGHDQIWLEGLKVRTSPETDRRDPAELEGPMESLAYVMEEFKHDARARQSIVQELDNLRARLPGELSVGRQAMPLEDQAWISDLIDAAYADVVGRLNASDRSDSSSAG